MEFRPDAVRGARSSANTVEYRLARRHIVNEFRRGRLSRGDVCDAHPELLRVGEHLGTPTDTTCPICQEVPLVHVSFVFGSGLPSNGRAVANDQELAKLTKTIDEVTLYVVEVCMACRWNHLHRVLRIGKKRAATASRH